MHSSKVLFLEIYKIHSFWEKHFALENGKKISKNFWIQNPKIDHRKTWKNVFQIRWFKIIRRTKTEMNAKKQCKVSQKFVDWVFCFFPMISNFAFFHFIFGSSNHLQKNILFLEQSNSSRMFCFFYNSKNYLFIG